MTDTNDPIFLVTAVGLCRHVLDDKPMHFNHMECLKCRNVTRKDLAQQESTLNLPPPYLPLC